MTNDERMVSIFRDVYGMTRQKYAEDLRLLRAAGDLLGLHADLKAQRERIEASDAR